MANLIVPNYSQVGKSLVEPKFSASSERQKWQTKRPLEHHSRIASKRNVREYKGQKIRLKYDFLRAVAVKKITYEIESKLAIMINTLKCDNKNIKYPNTDIPNRLFSWAYEDFLERRHLKDSTWLHMLNLEFSAECLSVYKWQADLLEYVRYAKLIMDSLRGQTTENSSAITEEVVPYVKSAAEYLDIDEKLPKELKSNQEFKEPLQLALQSTQNAIRHSLKDIQIRNLIEAEDFVMPIQQRYRINRYDNACNQFEFIQKSKEKKLATKIETLKQIKHDQDLAAESIIGCYSMQIQSYHEQLQDLRQKYDDDYEKIETALDKKRTNIKSLILQRRFLAEQVQYFHNVIDDYNKKDQAEKELRLARQAEADALAKTEALLKTKSKKKKGSKKKKKK